MRPDRVKALISSSEAVWNLVEFSFREKHFPVLSALTIPVPLILFPSILTLIRAAPTFRYL
jgi:hypothetical protein